MNKLNKTVNSILIIVITIIMSIPINAFASNNIEPLKGKTITDSQEIQEYAKQKQIPFIENGKEISKIVIVKEIEKETEEKPLIATRALGDLYQEISPMNWTSSTSCATTSGHGPGSLSLSTSYSESATISATFSYSKNDLGAAIGFSLTQTYTISPSYSINLSSKQYATIYAYPIYKGSAFKKTNLLTGNVQHGTAYRPVGTSYEVVYR